MPMPQPKPTTEGPMVLEQLATLVGAPYWEPGRFDRAVAMCLADGLVVRRPDGLLAAS